MKKNVSDQRSQPFSLIHYCFAISLSIFREWGDWGGSRRPTTLSKILINLLIQSVTIFIMWFCAFGRLMPLHTRKQFISFHGKATFSCQVVWWLGGRVVPHQNTQYFHKPECLLVQLKTLHCASFAWTVVVACLLQFDAGKPTIHNVCTSIIAFCVIFLVVWLPVYLRLFVNKELLPLVNLLTRTLHTRTRIQMDTCGRHFPWKPFNNYCEHFYILSICLFSRIFVAFVNNARMARAPKVGVHRE